MFQKRGANQDAKEMGLFVVHILNKHGQKMHICNNDMLFA